MESAAPWRARPHRPALASSSATSTRRPWRLCPVFPGLRRGASMSPIARKCSRPSPRSNGNSAGSTASFVRRRSNRGRWCTRWTRRSGIACCAINLDGVVWCYQAVVAGMIARGRGSIVAFTSGLAHQGWPRASAYAASKAALIAFAKSAAKEIAPHRVRFNLIAPGVIDTPQYRAANAGADDARWRASVGVGRRRMPSARSCSCCPSRPR